MGFERKEGSESVHEKLYPQLIEVDPRKIRFNERNPRKHQGAEYLRLRESVKEIGVVQLPTVRRLAGGFYECIDGEGRIKAAQEAGLEKIWVICLDIIDDVEALTMLQAANVVRSFSYLSGCKGLANLHREGQTYETIARNLGVSSRIVKTDVSVGYFPEQTIALIQHHLLQSSEEDREGKRTLLWSAHTFYTLLPLRIQIRARGDTRSLDGLYDYTEVHRTVEKIIHGEIATHEQLQLHVEQRRRELFEERFDKTLQMRLEEELAQAKQTPSERGDRDGSPPRNTSCSVRTATGGSPKAPSNHCERSGETARTHCKARDGTATEIARNRRRTYKVTGPSATNSKGGAIN
jgi:ParB/RepB/Spo0J family partition protein